MTRRPAQQGGVGIRNDSRCAGSARTTPGGFAYHSAMLRWLPSTGTIEGVCLFKRGVEIARVCKLPHSWQVTIGCHDGVEHTFLARTEGQGKSAAEMWAFRMADELDLHIRKLVGTTSRGHPPPGSQG